MEYTNYQLAITVQSLTSLVSKGRCIEVDYATEIHEI